ncbi:hypothetical protein BC829DRAFT_247775 [Chytridium lagenaria]|nr:hypothetical protein BC829DRAFT_247775 [Chytridium lagenaria]
MQKIQESIEHTDRHIGELKDAVNNVFKPVTSTLPDELPIKKDIELSIQTFLDNHTDQEIITTPKLLSILTTIDAKLHARLASDDAELTAIKSSISDKEREWQDQTLSSLDDVHGLYNISWTFWPWTQTWGYEFDYFISYRVSSESALARELRLELELRGKKAFLDQEELKDGLETGFRDGVEKVKGCYSSYFKGMYRTNEKFLSRC